MENEFISFIKDRARSLDRDSRIEIGIGDDAAVLANPDRPVVVTTDSIVDGVHFNSATDDFRLIGRKALAVNLSDLAAMGATAHSFVFSLVAGKNQTMPDCQSMVTGILELAEKYDSVLTGGDFVQSNGPLTLTVTALGILNQKPWRLTGARPGDSIFVTGPLGGSILGWHLEFEPRLDWAQKIQKQNVEVRAATDISDGLLVDLDSICQSSFVAAELDLSRVPVSNAATQRARQTGRSPLAHALEDGEDFELILVAGSESSNVFCSNDDANRSIYHGLVKIGDIVEGQGIWSLEASGRRELQPKGYRH